HTRSKRDWSSDVCSSDLFSGGRVTPAHAGRGAEFFPGAGGYSRPLDREPLPPWQGAAKCKRNLSKTGEKWAGSEKISKNAKACKIGRASCRERGKVKR